MKNSILLLAVLMLLTACGAGDNPPLEHSEQGCSTEQPRCNQKQ